MTDARMLDEDEAAAVKERVAELTGGTKQPDDADADDEPVAPCYSREWLREQYHDKGLTLAEVAKKCGVTAGAIRNRMENLGIPRRGRGRRPKD